MSKVAIVTGAAGAFGKWISRRLYEKGYSVVLVCRSVAQASESIAWIQETASPKGTGELIPEQCDLASYSSIKSFAARYLVSNRPLHCLINNAAASPTTRTETVDGLEVQFGVNIFAYWLLVELLMPALKASGSKGDPARVVNVASWYAGGLDTSDVEWRRRKYDNNKGYTQSKQANRLLTYQAAKKYPEIASGTVWVCSVMPAYSPSKLTVDLGTAGGAPDDPSVGAVGPVWAATDPSIATVANAGKWVPEKGKIEDDEFATGDGEKQAEALWKYCADTRDRLEGKSEL